MAARDESAELAAVIAAAIYAMLGERHIVHIGEARPASGWTLEYRALVHTSHAPRATHAAGTYKRHYGNGKPPPQMLG